MKRIAITGSRGVIGSILVEGLTDFTITGLDLPETDICDYPVLLERLRGHDALIHLAWVSESAPQMKALHHDNFTMIQQVYRGAVDAGVGRVIMASSVHAADVRGLDPATVSRLSETGTPNGAYGAAKQFGESLGRYYAGKGLDVTCVRFGAVNQQDTMPTQNEFERVVWLRHVDLLRLMSDLLTAPVAPGSFQMAIAVSGQPLVTDQQGSFPLFDTDAERAPALA